MILNTLIQYNHIVIQCHNNPDADTIASGFALYSYLKDLGKKVRLIYSGDFIISKPNLRMMVEHLCIPIEYVTELESPDLLVTVDCQYYNNNLTHFEAKEICVLDHHIPEDYEYPLSDIRPYLGSCSTLLWHLLKQAHFDFDNYPNVGTALYYGLITDTNHLSEARHPLDRDMADTIHYDPALIRKLKNSNLSLTDLQTAGIALIHCSMNAMDKFAVLEARPCDPNILGFISDLAIQVDNIHTCIVYCKNEEGIKYSLRSCIKEVKANEFAQYVSKNIGSGGGHLDKAGGLISIDAFSKEHGVLPIKTYFHNITKEYFKSFDILYHDEYEMDISTMKLYNKYPSPLGFVVSTDIFPPKIPICIRTLEGDLDLITSPDLYLLVEDNGHVRPIHRITFKRNYKITNIFFNLSPEYTPIATNKESDVSHPLSNFLKECVPLNCLKVYAKPLTKNLKVFTRWDKELYISGYIGDYLVIQSDDFLDISIEPQHKFHKSYYLLEDTIDTTIN